MEVGPSVAAMRVVAANHRQRRRLNGRGRERGGKGSGRTGSGAGREGERERTTVEVSKEYGQRQNRGCDQGFGM